MVLVGLAESTSLAELIVDRPLIPLLPLAVDDDHFRAEWTSFVGGEPTMPKQLGLLRLEA